jgi:hypothetical protein
VSAARWREGPLNVRDRCIELLLATYLDVRDQVGASMGGDGSGHAKPGSTPPLRNPYWREGSYPELERSLDSLKAKHPRCYRVVWDHDVCGRREDLGRNQKLRDHGFRYVADRMPDRVFAPQEITENASWETWQVRYARMPKAA